MKRTIGFCAGRVALLCVFSVTLTFSQRSPLRIHSININRQPIFDPTSTHEGKAIGSIVNSVHCLTREYVIRNELLYTEEDALNYALIHETERNLRALGIIGDIRTQIDTLSDSTVAITVHTRDKVAFGVSPSYSQGGGASNFSFTVKNDNFLGNAQSISLSYNYRSDRINPHGEELIFSERRLFGSRWGARAQIKNSEELVFRNISLQRTFFSEDTRWAIGFDFSDSRLEHPFYANGEKMRVTIFSQEVQTGFYARSFGDAVKVRPGVAFTRIRTSGNTFPRAFDNIDLLNFSMNIMQRRFYERVFLNNHGRIEDVPVGFSMNAIMGRNLEFSDLGGPKYYVQGTIQQAFFITSDYYLSASASHSRYVGGLRPKEATSMWQVLQYWQWRYDQTLAFRIAAVLGSDWSPDRQLHLGASTGLRGYENFAFSGQRRLVYNLEHRSYSRMQAWIFRLGAAAFVDGGTVWNSNGRLGDQRFHHAVGLGLRIENTKQQGAGTIRIDLAYNMDQKRWASVIISSSVLFSAFQEMNFLAPNSVGGY